LRLALVVIVVIGCTLATPALGLAQSGTACAAGVVPTYSHGFADLAQQLGQVMGSPTTCEYSDPEGTQDVEQQTTAGLAFWRKCTNMSTFTNGSTHWALTEFGLLNWTGNSIDPPYVVCNRPPFGIIRVINNTGGSLDVAVAGPFRDAWSVVNGQTSDHRLFVGDYQLTARAWCGARNESTSLRPGDQEMWTLDCITY
jgi:hypothetical protein